MQVNINRHLFNWVIENLLRNALDAMEGEGTIAASVSEEGHYLCIEISDTGKGIPADEIGIIFDEYKQVRGSDKESKGTGLGLSITKQFVELLRGSITVASELGKGSRFTVRIPRLYPGN